MPGPKIINDDSNKTASDQSRAIRVAFKTVTLHNRGLANMWRLTAIPLFLFSNLVSAAEKCDVSFHAISIAKPRYAAPTSGPEFHSVSVLFEFIIAPDGEISKIKALQSSSRQKNGFTGAYEHRARQALVASRFTKVEEACIGQYRFTFNLPE